MNWIERDKKHLWHPLTQHKTHANHLPIVKAKDCYLFDHNNKRYIDAIASWYTCMYGHCNPKIVEAASKQMKQLDQIVFSGFTHPAAIELSETLLAILPNNQQKLFFSDNGSTTIDIAIKMALQYHFNKGQKRDTIIAFENGFHGDTFGAMSVSGLEVYNGPFEEFSLNVIRISVPNKGNKHELVKELENLISNHRVAAFVFEPLVQGAAAMQMHDAEGLSQLIQLCNDHDVITIADEVMTGFGKTGTYFASEQLTASPEIICLSKALTAGLVPMGITSCSKKIYDAFLSEDKAHGFFHGHTYSANPIACAVAKAGIELLVSEEIQNNIQQIIKMHNDFGEHIIEHKKVASIRQLGVIFALDLNIEMERYGNLRDQLFNFYLKNGVFLRPLGNTIYISPPFTISSVDLKEVYKVIEASLEIV
ncbi:MAG: adenosylmethionine--8-amino-7-oxononanoate transaminase [bacterium]